MVAEDPSSVGTSTVMILDVLSGILVGVAVGSAQTSQPPDTVYSESNPFPQ